MNRLADYALDLLNSEALRPPRNEHFDALLRDLADHLVDPDDPASEFDLVTLSALVDGGLEEGDRAAAMARVRENPRKLQQLVELHAVVSAFDDEAPRESLSDLHVADEFVPPSRSAEAEVISLAERRASRRMLVVAGSIAALLMVGLVLLVTGGQTLPDPLDVTIGDSGAQVRSASRPVGASFALEATVAGDAHWAVVVAAVPANGQPIMAWVAQTSQPGSDAGRVRFEETLAGPPGRRAYVLVASRSPLDALPALIPDWERGLRSSASPDTLLRDLQAIVDAEAGAHAWRVSEAVALAVAEADL